MSRASINEIHSNEKRGEKMKRQRTELLLPPSLLHLHHHKRAHSSVHSHRCRRSERFFFLSHPFMRRRLNNLLPGLVLFGMMRTFRMDWPLKIFDGVGSRSWLNTRNRGYVFVQTQYSHVLHANSAEFDIRLGRKSTKKTKTTSVMKPTAAVGRRAISN